MRLFLATAASFALTLAGTAAAADVPLHYFTLVNGAHDSVTELAVAPAGSAAFRALAIGTPLRGGGGATTLQIAGDACLHDVRVRFRDDRVQLYRNVDVCGRQGLRLRPAGRAEVGEARLALAASTRAD